MFNILIKPSPWLEYNFSSCNSKKRRNGRFFGLEFELSRRIFNSFQIYNLNLRYFHVI